MGCIETQLLMAGCIVSLRLTLTWDVLKPHNRANIGSFITTINFNMGCIETHLYNSEVL